MPTLSSLESSTESARGKHKIFTINWSSHQHSSILWLIWYASTITSSNHALKAVCVLHWDIRNVWGRCCPVIFLFLQQYLVCFDNGTTLVLYLFKWVIVDMLLSIINDNMRLQIHEWLGSTRHCMCWRLWMGCCSNTFKQLLGLWKTSCQHCILASVL